MKAKNELLFTSLLIVLVMGLYIFFISSSQTQTTSEVSFEQTSNIAEKSSALDSVSVNP